MQDLAVDEDVKAGKVIPGQYLVLSINFARPKCLNDLTATDFDFNQPIIGAIKDFYRKYGFYLGMTAEELIENEIIPNNATASFTNCISFVLQKLQNSKGVKNHPLADVKGVRNR